MSTPQQRTALLLEQKTQLLNEQDLAENELKAIRLALAAAKDKWRKNPHVKQATTQEDRRDEISVFLARRELNKDSVLRQKGEDTFEREKEEAFEVKRQRELKVQLAYLKTKYVEERSEATSLIRVEGSERKSLVAKAARGEWTGTTPLSRVKGGPKSKAEKGAKDLKDIPLRYPHSLFDRDSEST